MFNKHLQKIKLSSKNVSRDIFGFLNIVNNDNCPYQECP